MAWRRGKTLGNGSFATVTLAHSTRKSHRTTNLPSKFAAKSALISQFRSLHNEKSILSRFQDCPFIIRYFGFDITLEKGALIYSLLLEYANGGSLMDRIRSQGALPEVDVKRYTQMVLLGLVEIHDLGYVHCDIKPHNLLISKGNRCLLDEKVRSFCGDLGAEEILKISDFGLARKAGVRRDSDDLSVILSGTPRYMAPETVKGDVQEPCSDIWALGCTVLQMITGKSPWNCDNLEELLYLIGNTTRIPEIPFWISTDAADFLKKCLVRDPKKRWTAKMLLEHPFMVNLSICDDNFLMVKEEEEEQSFEDLPKPTLLMSGSLNSDCVLPRLLMMKRKRVADVEEKSISNYRYRRCG